MELKTPQSSPGDDAMTAYRDWLVSADQKSSQAYDKAVMTLSGGALGLSLTFVKEIAPNPLTCTKWMLAAAWASLTVSLTSILISMLTSQWALRKAIRQVDAGLEPDTKIGGFFSRLTIALNILSGLMFVAGVALLAWFSARNF
jgi:hypothetical protein